jgi:predicted RNase H-like HicB family nuclease
LQLGEEDCEGYTFFMAKVKGRAYEYTVFFEANENSGYTVTVPALPGLVTEGKNLEDARRMAKDAIRCYIEGLKKAKESVPVERETAQLKLSVVA